MVVAIRAKGSGVTVAFERLLTNVFLLFGDVFALLTYVPNYLFSFNTIRRASSVRAIQIAREKGEVTFQNVNAIENPVVIPADAQTVADQWAIAVQRFRHHDCLGYRIIEAEEDEVQANGKVFQKLQLGGYIWKNYEEIDEAAEMFGRCLYEIIQSDSNGQNKNVVIFSETRMEWMVAFLGCAKYNLTVVTLYSTLSEEAVLHGIVESEATILVASADGLCKIKKIESRADCAKVKTVVWFPNQVNKVQKSMFPDRIRVLDYEETLEAGRRSSARCQSRASAEDVAVIMYTSGSTGLPKGVMLTHTNLVTSFGALPEYIEDMGSNDTYIGYLPMAHVLELTCECICLLHGTRIGYSSPFTLSDKSTKIKKGGTGDATVLRPTLITAVPLVMDRIYKGVVDQVANMSLPKRILFNFALQYKAKQVARFFPTPIVDFVVFRKIRNSLGGQVRFVLSGGAPLSASTHEFMKVCFSCPVIQGYGLTETTGGITVVDSVDGQLGQVGGPSRAALIKLVDWEEGSYRVTDSPRPRGEIAISSGQVALGYYKKEEMTRESFMRDSEGLMWFYSGDIGEIDELGRCRIIDRKKDLVKLATGEYVSLGKIEMTIKTNKYVENVCVYADSSEMYTVMLVVPNEKAISDLSASLGTGLTEVADMCECQLIHDTIFQDITTHCDQKKLDKLEMPQKMILTSCPWTPDTGLVTDSFKLKRKELARVYAEEFAWMYNKGNKFFAKSGKPKSKIIPEQLTRCQ